MFSHNDGAFAPISEVSKIFDDVDRELSDEPNEDQGESRGDELLEPKPDELLEPGLGVNRDTDNPDDLDILDDEIESNDLVQEKGLGLNQLYAQYLVSPNDEDTLARLLVDVENYARRVTALEAGKKAQFLNQTVTDKHPETEISVAAMAKVHVSLDKFNHQSKFSTWVYSIVKNLVIDAVRQIDRRKEVDLFEWRANDAPYAGTKGAAEGTSPDGVSDPEDESGDDGGGHAAAPILLQEYFNQNEDGINANLDFEKVFRKLSKRDQRMVELFRDGYKPADIGKEFGYDAKWASNQLTRLKELLKHELYIAETICHSCKPGIQTTATLANGQLYIDDGAGYRSLPMCRCKKRLTGLEAKTLIRNGEAYAIYKVVNGEPVVCRHEVWAQHAVKTPRCGLNSNQADIERAYLDGNRQSQLDIEIAYEMTQASLRKLIVPFRPDLWEGQVRFTNFVEERTKGSFQPFEWHPPEPKEVPIDRQTIVTDKAACCPNCKRTRMTASVYLDGSIKHECNGGYCYLVLWKPPTSKSPVSNVLVLESNTSLPASEAVAD
jgi:RNA polymerase sigma factor (sigma-70 family)